MTLPIVMTSAGRQPTSPSDLRSQLVTIAEGLSPGLTTDLPGELIEDIASTDVGALSVIDSALTDLIASVTPYGANAYILGQLGAMLGITQGVGSNASVYVVFYGTPGFTVNVGFTVSDGTHQFVVQDGGVVGSSGASPALYCLCTVSGTFPVPENTVTTLATSVPSTIVLTCNNPTAGTPATSDQSVQDYRAQVLDANVASAQGFTTCLKTQLLKVPGVLARTVSVQQSGSSWKVLCAGGDPYAVAYAIFMGVANPADLIGSILNVTGITNANPGVMTVDKAHGFSTGQVIGVTGVTGMSGINGVSLTVTVTAPSAFSLGINTTSSGAYVGGGIVTPNLRNVSVSINDYPDTYVIPIVTPLAQTVGVFLVWNTTSPNFVSDAAITQLGQPAVVGYINGLTAGQAINIFELQEVFKSAVSSILQPSLISRLVITFTLNGVAASPVTGTGIVLGDAESYFVTSATGVSISRG